MGSKGPLSLDFASGCVRGPNLHEFWYPHSDVAVCCSSGSRLFFVPRFAAMEARKVFEFYIANLQLHIRNSKLVIKSQLTHAVYQVWIGNIRHGKSRDEVWTALCREWRWTFIQTVTLCTKPYPQDSFAFIEFETDAQALQISNSCLNTLKIKNVAFRIKF